MRIGREKRPSRRRLVASHDPRVARSGRDTEKRGARLIESGHPGGGSFERGSGERSGRVRRDRETRETICILPTDGGGEIPAKHLDPAVVRKDVRHRFPDGEAVGGLPRRRSEIEETELRRQAIRVSGEIGVHAGRVRFEDFAGFGSHSVELHARCGGEAHPAREAIRRKSGGAEDLREPTRSEPPGELHLKEPILGVGVSHRAREIPDVGAEKVSDAVLVAEHLDGRRESLELRCAFDLGKRGSQLIENEPSDPASDEYHNHQGEKEEPEPSPAGTGGAFHPARGRGAARPTPGGRCLRNHGLRGLRGARRKDGSGRSGLARPLRRLRGRAGLRREGLSSSRPSRQLLI